MEVTAGRLRRALAIVEVARPKKPKMPILATVRLGEGRVVAQNLEVAVAASLPEAQEPMLLPVAAMGSVLKGAPAGARVRIESTGSELKVTVGRVSATFTSPPVEDYPPAPSLPAETSGALPGDALVAGLATVRPYAATEDTRPVLNAVLLKLGRTVELVAADGFRLAVKTIANPFPTPDDGERSIIVPLAVVAALLRTWALTPHTRVQPMGPDAMNDIANVVAQRRLLALSHDTEGNLGFAFDGTEVITREVQGTFPNYATLIPRDQPHELIVSGGAFYGAVRQLRDLAKDGAGIVRLEWEGDHLTVSARALEVGQASITILLLTPVAAPGRVAVNNRYMLEASGQAMEGILTIRASEPSNPIVVEATGLPTLVVMPMFVRWEGEAQPDGQPVEAGAESPEAEDAEEEHREEPEAGAARRPRRARR